MTRYETIVAAYNAAIGDRNPGEVDILDILPAIDAAVPDATPAEIAAALRRLYELDHGVIGSIGQFDQYSGGSAAAAIFRIGKDLRSHLISSATLTPSRNAAFVGYTG